VPSDSILQAFQHLPQQSFEVGALLIKEGEHHNKLLILVEGGLEVMKGDLRVAISRKPGAVFGEISVLLDVPHTASVRAVEKSICYVLENPLAFLETHPEAALHVSKILARRLDSLTRYLVDVKQQFKEQEGHIGMVDEVLESLLHFQPRG
jgi:CRP/FNR family transcriptional regulator, cyclic AMP receptor protein